jgi:hypothetical protein
MIKHKITLHLTSLSRGGAAGHPGEGEWMKTVAFRQIF